MKQSPIIYAGTNLPAVTFTGHLYPDKRSDGTPLRRGDINIDAESKSSAIWVYMPKDGSNLAPGNGKNWVKRNWWLLDTRERVAIRTEIGAEECAERGWV